MVANFFKKWFVFIVSTSLPLIHSLQFSFYPHCSTETPLTCSLNPVASSQWPSSLTSVTLSIVSQHSLPLRRLQHRPLDPPLLLTDPAVSLTSHFPFPLSPFRCSPKSLSWATSFLPLPVLYLFHATFILTVSFITLRQITIQNLFPVPFALLTNNPSYLVDICPWVSY